MTIIYYICPNKTGTIQMKGSRNIILSGASTIMHSLIVPLFILVFTIYYKPYGAYELLNMAHAPFSFNVTILFCIILVSISITRGWLYLISKYKDISETAYLIWCLCETVVAALFASLYIVLISKEALAFFEVAGSSVIMLIATGFFPYSFLWMALQLYSKSIDNDTPAADENSLIRFYDEYKKLKLVIAPEAILFIKSEDNYVQINYTDNGRTKKFILRSSMRALEDNLSKHGLVRCHRSYFINPAFIKIVHRDNSGLIVAELKQEGFESIPISRKYQNEISRLL